MPVLENQLAGKNKQPLAFVATEMTETMVEQLRQFSGGKRQPDGRRACKPDRMRCRPGRIGNDKTNFRLLGQFHILVKMAIGVKRTADDIYQAV